MLPTGRTRRGSRRALPELRTEMDRLLADFFGGGRAPVRNRPGPPHHRRPGLSHGGTDGRPGTSAYGASPDPSSSCRNRS